MHMLPRIFQPTAFSIFLLVTSVCTGIINGCQKRQPQSCAVLPEGEDDSDAASLIQQLRQTFVNVTPNTTAFSGQAVTFICEIDTSLSPDAVPSEPIAFVDGCQDDTHCTSVEETNTKVTMECLFEAVNQTTDDGKKIQFYVFSHSLLAKLCYDPPSFLQVKGPPAEPVDVVCSLDACKGISCELILSSSITADSDTTMQYSLYYIITDNQPVLLLQSNFTTNNTVTIPPHTLYNHTGVYRFFTTPMNPAGNGPSNITSIRLANSNYSLFFSVDDKSSINVTDKNEFHLMIIIKVNSGCLLTVPNRFIVSSSCSNGDEVEYPVNMTHLLVNPDSPINIPHPLVRSKRNCTFNVTDETGNTQFMDTGQSTYHTRSYKIRHEEAFIGVLCNFTLGSTADGCWIVVQHQTNHITKQTLFPLLRQDYLRLGPFVEPGSYSVIIYDQLNGAYNRSDPVYTDSFTVQPTSVSSSLLSSSSSSTLISSYIIPSCTDNDCNTTDKATSPNRIIFTIIGTIIGVLVLALIIMLIVILSVFHCSRTRGKMVVAGDGKPQEHYAIVNASDPASDAIIAENNDPYAANDVLAPTDVHEQEPTPTTNTDTSGQNLTHHEEIQLEKDEIHVALTSHSATSSNTPLEDGHIQTEKPVSMKPGDLSASENVLVGPQSIAMEMMSIPITETESSLVNDSYDQLLPEVNNEPEPMNAKFSIQDSSPLPSPLPQSLGGNEPVFRRDSNATLTDEPRRPSLIGGGNVMVFPGSRNSSRIAMATDQRNESTNTLHAIPTVSSTQTLASPRNPSITTLKDQDGDQMIVPRHSSIQSREEITE